MDAVMTRPDWDDEQVAALVQILALGQADIEANRFRDVDGFLAELDSESPTAPD